MADRDATRKAFSKPAALVVLAKGLTLKTELTSERLRELLHYDPETGVFTWRIGRRGPKRAGDAAGALTRSGYIHIKIDGRYHLAHRLAVLLMTEAWPVEIMDHINGKKDDNAWANLRQASKSINAQNVRCARRDNLSSGLLGVSLAPSGKYQARIFSEGRSLSIGCFSSPELAHAAYIEAKRRLHPGCTL